MAGRPARSGCPRGRTRISAWVRRGGAQPVDEAQLPEIERSLTELTPVEGEVSCTAELGPRWLLVGVSSGGDLTGVVVDAFGCRHVRVTDEPFTTVPGEPRQAGTVRGVLTGPADLLDALHPAHAQ